MRILLCYAALCVACMAPALARQKTALPRVGILFLAPPPPVNAKLMKAFRKELMAVGAQNHEITLVGEAEITKLLHKDPRKFLRACGKQLSCLVTVTQKAKCDRLLMGRWVNPDSPQLQYAIIDAKTEGVLNKGAVNVASEADAASAARDNFAVIMGFAPPPDAPPLPSTLAPAAEKPVASLTPKPVAPSVKTTVGATDIPSEEPVASGSITHSDAWFISSVVLLGVGAGLAGTGGYLAIHGNQLISGISTGENGAPQTQVVSTYNQANSSISTGNILMYAGAGIGVAGAVILTLHELGIVGPKHVDATTTAAPEGGGHAIITPLPGGIDVGYSWAF